MDDCRLFCQFFFGMSVLSFRHPGPFSTLIFTSLALLASALIQVVNRTISLYNAIIVIYLCYLHSFSSLFVLNILCWVHRKRMHNTLSQLYLFQLIFLYGSTLLVIHTKKTFGSQPECNSGVHVTSLLGFCQWLIFDNSGCLQGGPGI